MNGGAIFNNLWFVKCQPLIYIYFLYTIVQQPCSGPRAHSLVLPQIVNFRNEVYNLWYCIWGAGWCALQFNISIRLNIANIKPNNTVALFRPPCTQFSIAYGGLDGVLCSFVYIRLNTGSGARWGKVRLLEISVTREYTKNSAVFKTSKKQSCSLFQSTSLYCLSSAVRVEIDQSSTDKLAR